jgi:hypothetical protein
MRLEGSKVGATVKQREVRPRDEFAVGMVVHEQDLIIACRQDEHIGATEPILAHSCMHRVMSTRKRVL